MLSKAAWKDVNDRRAAIGLLQRPYSECTDYTASTAYCYEYMQLIYERLGERLKRRPSQAEILAAYRAGINTLETCGYKTDHWSTYIQAVERNMK